MPDLVLLHGIGQTPQNWFDQVAAMPAGWNARVPWLAGFKPTDPPHFSVDSAVAGVLSEMDAHGIERAHLVGVSVGGVVALRLAARHPDRVDRLVVSGARIRSGQVRTKVSLELLRRQDVAALSQRGLDRERLLAVLTAMGQTDLSSDVRRVQAPTLVLVGHGDRPQLRQARLLARRIPGASLLTIDGGHLLNTDNPQGFNDAMLGFLADPRLG